MTPNPPNHPAAATTTPPMNPHPHLRLTTIRRGTQDNLDTTPDHATARSSPTETESPPDLTGPAAPAELADTPCQVARIGDEAALLAVESLCGDVDAEVRRASREVGEYLVGLRRRARVFRSAEGLCRCQGGASGAGRAPHLLPVEDPLDVRRQESRARLGAILGHCRCEPGAVAA